MSLQKKKNNENNYVLPGKPLTPKQLTQLIENSQKSGMISMQEAHKKIRDLLSKS